LFPERRHARALDRICQSFFQVDAVFIGTVETIAALSSGYLRVSFVDVERIRGDQGTATVITAADGPACGFPFRRGERYVVYASDSQVSSCSGLVARRTRRRIWNSLGPSQRLRQAVFGTITHWEREFASGRSSNLGDVADVIVTLRNESTAYETRTDVNGQYVLAGVAPGRYTLKFAPPPAFSPRMPEPSVTITDVRGCHEFDWRVTYDTRIRGIVKTNNGALNVAD
jgi:hypothetical protein